MTKVPTTSEAYAMLEQSLSGMCADLNSNQFRPLLESDVGCYLYYRMLENKCALEHLYSETRINGIRKGNRRFDLVVGHSETNDATVVPSLVVQIKCFQKRGQTIQQFHRRYHQIYEEDLPSLEQAYHCFADCEVEVVLDQAQTSTHVHGYLDGITANEVRHEYLTKRFTASSIKMYWICADDTGKMTTKVLA